MAASEHRRGKRLEIIWHNSWRRVYRCGFGNWNDRYYPTCDFDTKEIRFPSFPMRREIMMLRDGNPHRPVRIVATPLLAENSYRQTSANNLNRAAFEIAARFTRDYQNLTCRLRSQIDSVDFTLERSETTLRSMPASSHNAAPRQRQPGTFLIPRAISTARVRAYDRAFNRAFRWASKWAATIRNQRRM